MKATILLNSHSRRSSIYNKPILSHWLLFCLLVLIELPTYSHALNLLGRLGLGFSNQLANNLPALSFKVQNSKATAYGGLLAVDSNDQSTDYGLGLKFYRLLFDEPHLNFFASAMGALLKKNDLSGHQIDGTLGSEFHIPGLESIGFSLEFGLSWNKVNDEKHLETTGLSFINAGVHFYL